MSAKRSINEYAKYAGVGMEILACILLFVGIGYALDSKFDTEKPYFLLVFALIGCGLAMYILIRRFNKPQK